MGSSTTRAFMDLRGEANELVSPAVVTITFFGPWRRVQLNRVALLHEQMAAVGVSTCNVYGCRLWKYAGRAVQHMSRQNNNSPGHFLFAAQACPKTASTCSGRCGRVCCTCRYVESRRSAVRDTCEVCGEDKSGAVSAELEATEA
jgi:hypothetical protein